MRHLHSEISDAIICPRHGRKYPLLAENTTRMRADLFSKTLLSRQRPSCLSSNISVCHTTELSPGRPFKWHKPDGGEQSLSRRS